MGKTSEPIEPGHWIHAWPAHRIRPKPYKNGKNHYKTYYATDYISLGKTQKWGKSTSNQKTREKFGKSTNTGKIKKPQYITAAYVSANSMGLFHCVQS